MMQAPSIDWKGAQAGRFGPGGYLGVTSVPLPGSSSSIGRGRTDDKQQQDASVQVGLTWYFVERFMILEHHLRSTLHNCLVQYLAPSGDANSAACNYDRPDSQSVSGLQGSHPGVRAIQKSLLEALTEVHLRRLDTAEVLHRRAVATIAIEATPEEVLRLAS